MTDLFQKQPNKEGTWAVIDENGEVLETFRLRGTAYETLKKHKKSFRFGIRVVKYKDGQVLE